MTHPTLYSDLKLCMGFTSLPLCVAFILSSRRLSPVSHISNHEDKLRGAGGSVKGGEQEINHRETSSQGETDYRKPKELN